jgi:hypothetical protein
MAITLLSVRLQDDQRHLGQAYSWQESSAWPSDDQSHLRGLQMTSVICMVSRWPVSSAWPSDDHPFICQSRRCEHCHLQGLKMTALSLAIWKRMTTMAVICFKWPSYCHLQGREWDNPAGILGAYVWQLFYMICESLDDNKMHAVVCGQWTRHNMTIWALVQNYFQAPKWS